MKYNQVEPNINEDDIDNINEYLRSGGWITEHAKTKELEKEISNFVGREYAVAVPNGTIAIYLSLLGLGLKNKKIAVPNITMIATVNAILWADSTPVLIDVDENLCMSYEDLVVHKDLDAVIFVPLNGRTGDGEKINDWCKETGINFIEDSAHALGSSYENTMCGNLGDMSIFSFTPHKIITMGQGGMVLTDDQEKYEFLTNLKTFNRQKDKADWHEDFGLNFKITDLQATLGLSQFERIDSFINNKKENYKNYLRLIDNDAVSVLGFSDNEVPWFFDIKLDSLSSKEEFSNQLNKEEIETRNLYPALSKQKFLKKYRESELLISERIHEKILWLPSSNSLVEEDIEYISEKINSVNA